MTRLLACVSGLLLLAGAAAAQSFPSKPITIVVPYAPGASDQEARALGGALEKLLGQPVQVENRAGAGGALGAQHVANARADGHTLLYAASSVITVAPHQRDLPYGFADLVPVARITAGPHFLAGATAAPFKDLAGLIAYAKAKPGKVAYGSAGVGSATHLAGEAFARAARIELNHVPFQGVNPAVTAAVGGTVELVIGLPLALWPQVEGGKLHAIAQFGDTRSKGLPTVTTLKEGGVDLVLAPNFGIFAPKPLPPEILAKLTQGLGEAVASPTFLELGERTRSAIAFVGPTDFARLLADEDKFYADLLRALGLAKK